MKKRLRDFAQSAIHAHVKMTQHIHTNTRSRAHTHVQDALQSHKYIKYL